jgi:hypothetical protein
MKLTQVAKSVYDHMHFAHTRANLERIFGAEAAHGVVAELCGRSGFRIVPTGGKGIPLTGAETTLSTLCWYPCTKRKRSTGDTRSTKSGSVRFEDGRSYFGRSGGQRRGADVHTEVAHYMCWSEERFNAAHPKVDPMTHAVIMALIDRHIKCFDAERIVWDRGWRVGTAFDLLGVHRTTGELLAFELKTGSDGCFDMCDDPAHAYMRAPFDQVSNTPLNRARFQLLLGVILAERTFNVRFARAYVIHAPSGTKPAVLHDLGPVAQYHDALILELDRWRPSVLASTPTPATFYA